MCFFSDETKLKVDSSDKRQHIYRRNGERFQEACVREVDRRGRASVMIWAEIFCHVKTDIVFVNYGFGGGGRRGRGRGLTAHRYVDDVLHPVAVPYLRRFPGMALHHDIARPQFARVTTQYLRNNNIDVLENGPARSAVSESHSTLL